MGEYYPCHFRETPSFEKKLLDFLGEKSSHSPYGKENKQDFFN